MVKNYLMIRNHEIIDILYNQKEIPIWPNDENNNVIEAIPFNIADFPNNLLLIGNNYNKLKHEITPATILNNNQTNATYFENLIFNDNFSLEKSSLFYLKDIQLIIDKYTLQLIEEGIL